MHLYTGTASRFLADNASGTLASKLETRFVDEFRFRPPESEVRAWSNSLAAMGDVIQMRGFSSQGVLVEYQLPLTSRRLDCMFTGHDSAGTRSAVIVELNPDPPRSLAGSVRCGVENDLLSVHELRAPASDVNGARRRRRLGGAVVSVVGPALTC